MIDGLGGIAALILAAWLPLMALAAFRDTGNG